MSSDTRPSRLEYQVAQQGGKTVRSWQRVLDGAREHFADPSKQGRTYSVLAVGLLPDRPNQLIRITFSPDPPTR